ncbi:MAG: hypothetical protein K2P93_05605 [Alphaproteobacteria bacterium]|nr:hypothetical protein [Alphaproteobacteria bacterium]
MKYGLTITGTVLGFLMTSSGVISVNPKQDVCPTGYTSCPGYDCIVIGSPCPPHNIVHFTPAPNTTYALPRGMGFFCGTTENPQAPQKITVPGGAPSEYWICPSSSEPAPQSKPSQENGSHEKLHLAE